MTKIKKQNEAKNMIQYTYRDYGQEYLMKKKMVRAVIWSILTTVALLVFITLYVGEVRRVQETYRTQYQKHLKNLQADIASYLNADGDYEFRYRIATADMASATSFAFLLKNFTEEQKVINELYTAFIKYPVQMKEKLSETSDAIEDVLSGLEKGYDELQAIVDSLDLKGY